MVERIQKVQTSNLYPLRTITKILFLIISWVLYKQKYKKIIPKETIVI